MMLKLRGILFDFNLEVFEKIKVVKLNTFINMNYKSSLWSGILNSSFMNKTILKSMKMYFVLSNKIQLCALPSKLTHPLITFMYIY